MQRLKATWSYLFAPLAAIAFYVAVPAVAHAQEGDSSQSWWEFLLSHLVELAAAILTPVLTLLALKGYAWLSQKLRLERNEAVEAQLRAILERAIGVAEEKAHKALDRGDQVPRSDEKLQTAITLARKWIEEAGLPKLATAELEQRIEAWLGVKRAEADASTLLPKPGG